MAIEKIKCEVLRGFCLGAGRDVYPGDKIDLTPGEARLYGAQNRVRPIPEGEHKGQAQRQTRGGNGDKQSD